ncbi:hypothetical protein KCU81_g23, partial [Aureobasidium melanogenum]
LRVQVGLDFGLHHVRGGNRGLIVAVAAVYAIMEVLRVAPDLVENTTNKQLHFKYGNGSLDFHIADAAIDRHSLPWLKTVLRALQRATPRGSHISPLCCDESQGTLCTNDVLALESGCSTLASLVGSASGRSVDGSGRTSETERQSLVTKGQVLSNRLVVALSVGDIEIGEVVRVQEEHVLLLVQILETAGIVGEFITREWLSGSGSACWASSCSSWHRCQACSPKGHLGNTKNVINITDNSKTGLGYEICSGIANACTLDEQRHRNHPQQWCCMEGLQRTLRCGRIKVNRSDSYISLLDNKDAASHIAGSAIEVCSRGVGLLVDIAVESDIPARLGPIGIGVKIEDLSGQCRDLSVVEAERRDDSITNGSPLMADSISLTPDLISLTTPRRSLSSSLGLEDATRWLRKPKKNAWLMPRRLVKLGLACVQGRVGEKTMRRRSDYTRQKPGAEATIQELKPIRSRRRVDLYKQATQPPSGIRDLAI